MQDHRFMSLHQDDNNEGPAKGPVTVIVTRKARRGMINEFEEWMDGVTHEAMKFEGHMGVDIIRPSDASNPEYVIIFRFNNYRNLSKWETSQIRHEWIEKSKEVTEGEPKVQKMTGLEFWFTPLSSGNKEVIPPPRYKMAIVTGAVVFTLLGTLIPPIIQMTSSLPIIFSTLVGVVIMVLLMTYVVMPTVTTLLKPWLVKKRLF